MRDNYVFFWNGFCSQWEPAKMTIDGIEYNSCEQYMMHQKALTFGDTEVAAKILETNSPSNQKALGKQIKGFDRAVWDRKCFGIVYKGNYAKFSQNEDLKQLLLATGDRIIVEASPVDFIWGIEMFETDEGITDPSNWKGLNLLGWAIMAVRKNLQ